MAPSPSRRVKRVSPDILLYWSITRCNELLYSVCCCHPAPIPGKAQAKRSLRPRPPRRDGGVLDVLAGGRLWHEVLSTAPLACARHRPSAPSHLHAFLARIRPAVSDHLPPSALTGACARSHRSEAAAVHVHSFRRARAVRGQGWGAGPHGLCDRQGAHAQSVISRFHSHSRRCVLRSWAVFVCVRWCHAPTRCHRQQSWSTRGGAGTYCCCIHLDACAGRVLPRGLWPRMARTAAPGPAEPVDGGSTADTADHRGARRRKDREGLHAPRSPRARTMYQLRGGDWRPACRRLLPRAGADLGASARDGTARNGSGALLAAVRRRRQD